MARVLPSALALLIVSVLSGCSGQTKDLGDPSSPEGIQGTLGASSSPEAAEATPTVFNWTGRVLDTDSEDYTHVRPTEDALWPVSKSGILFSVDKLPQTMEVSLDWKGSGQFKIMLHSHKAHGTNVYVEHVTKMDRENPKCLRVPAKDLAEGVWQVMVHSNRTMQTDFTLHIGLLGGAGHIIEDERHGHWVQDGDFKVDLHDIEPCRLLQAPVDNATGNATIPTTLPPKTHFEFGESLGCWERYTSSGPSCIEFKAGPGGTGSAIDGHWIQLNQSYWGLLLTSTIGQVGVGNDSDCVFTDADGIIIAEADNVDQPCTGEVPPGTDWAFIYPANRGALSITVDFVLRPAA